MYAFLPIIFLAVSPWSLAAVTSQEQIQATADQVQFIRYILSEAGIIRDPIAPLYFQKPGEQTLEQYFQSITGQPLKNMTEALGIMKARSETMAEGLRQAIDEGIDQVVLLGAGRTPLPFLFPESAQVHYFEVDMNKEDLKEKYRRLKQTPLKSQLKRVHPVPFELPGHGNNLIQALQKHRSFDPTKKTLWVVEGLLYYLDKQQVSQLMGTIERHSVAGSIAIGDHANAISLKLLGFIRRYPLITKVARQVFSRISDEMFYNFRSGFDSPDDLGATETRVLSRRIFRVRKSPGKPPMDWIAETETQEARGLRSTLVPKPILFKMVF